jgi:hypothetical protein
LRAGFLRRVVIIVPVQRAGAARESGAAPGGAPPMLGMTCRASSNEAMFVLRRTGVAADGRFVDWGIDAPGRGRDRRQRSGPAGWKQVLVVTMHRSAA